MIFYSKKKKENILVSLFLYLDLGFAFRRSTLISRSSNAKTQNKKTI